MKISISSIENKQTMAPVEPKFCFCTLALGKKYHAMALLLAKDIETYAPYTSLIVLTDNINAFSQQHNILAFKHRQDSIKCYHDKRFAIAKSLSIFNSCIFLDADVRILAPVPPDIEWIQLPGISARACSSIKKKHNNALLGIANTYHHRSFEVTKKAAQKFNIEFEDEKIKFVYEYLFAVTKDSGREIEFLKEWDRIAPYFELNGVYMGEGNAIGLAAAKAGLEVRWSDMSGISFFKDRRELQRIKQGEGKIEEISIYLEQQRKLENPNLSCLEKVANKLKIFISYLFYNLRLRLITLKDFNFYYR